MIAEPEVKPCYLRGELARLVDDLEAWKGPREVLEVLIEGPRGSAKSRGTVTHLVWNLMCDYPGSKWLAVRKTRESLTKSFCQTFEREAVPEHMRAAVVGDADASHRSHYQHPNGSWLGLVGLDRPSKHQGMNIDGVILEEATEVVWKQVEPFFGAIREFTPGLPFQLFLALTNPGPPSHWLNQRAERGLMRRVRTTLRDNPKWYTKDGELTEEGSAFLKSLGRYTGVSKLRHVDGIWAGAEGQVWENYDPAVHLIRPDAFEAEWVAHPDRRPIEFRASIDWGFADTGVLGVWGIDAKKRAVCVDRVYQSKRTLEWWARTFVMLANEYNITRAVADPSRPDAIQLFGDWLVRAGKPRIVYPANNKRASTPGGDLGGLDLVRWGFERDLDGVPRLRFLDQPPRLGIDENLRADGKPFLGYDEIPAYVFATDSNGEVIGDRTDPACRDDFCDKTRYMASDIWPRTVTPTPAPPIVYGPNTYAGMVGTPESRMLAKLKREREMW